MNFKVRNWYSPDELREIRNNWKMIACLGGFFLITAYILLAAEYMKYGVGDDGRIAIPDDVWWMWTTVQASFLLIGAYFFIFWLTANNEYDLVCRGLAGLELGVYHSVDDLTIIGRMGRDHAEQIVNGDFDDFLRDEKTCKMIGKPHVPSDGSLDPDGGSWDKKN